MCVCVCVCVVARSERGCRFIDCVTGQCTHTHAHAHTHTHTHTHTHAHTHTHTHTHLQLENAVSLEVDLEVSCHAADWRLEERSLDQSIICHKLNLKWCEQWLHFSQSAHFSLKELDCCKLLCRNRKRTFTCRHKQRLFLQSHYKRKKKKTTRNTSEKLTGQPPHRILTFDSTCLERKQTQSEEQSQLQKHDVLILCGFQARSCHL